MGSKVWWIVGLGLKRVFRIWSCIVLGVEDNVDIGGKVVIVMMSDDLLCYVCYYFICGFVMWKRFENCSYRLVVVS